MPDRSSLPKNQPLPLHPPSDWRAGWGKGWHNSALHLFKGQGGAPELLAWDFCTLEERSSSPRSSTMSCVSAGSDGELQGQLFWGCCFVRGAASRSRTMGEMLAWQEGACTILLQLLISPCAWVPAAGGSQDPCYIYYRRVAAISPSGRGVFSLQGPFGEECGEGPC